MLKRVCVITMILTATAGCSSLHAKMNGKVGEPYAGFEESKTNFANCTVVSILAFPPLALVVAPVMAVEVVGSLALDTVFLPIDLMSDETDVYLSNACEMHYSI